MLEVWFVLLSRRRQRVDGKGPISKILPFKAQIFVFLDFIPNPTVSHQLQLK